MSAWFEADFEDLIGAFALHIHSAYSLTRMNHAARTVGYQSKRDYIAANFASQTCGAGSRGSTI